jgi:hypothetical protein
MASAIFIIVLAAGAADARWVNILAALGTARNDD